MNETQIIHKYIVNRFIGKGKFGNVLEAYHKKTNEPVAIKLESLNSPIHLLKNETAILNYLYNMGSRNIPIVFWYGLYKDNVCLAMTLYQCSLYDYLIKKSLTPAKIYSIIIQSISIIQNIHSHFVIHRDIKPHNFMIKDGELFLIDFGFATFFIDDRQQHLPNGELREHIIGTPNYISINVHNGVQSSRRDDLISLGYMFILLFFGELSWINPSIDINACISDYEPIHINHHKNQFLKSQKTMDNIEKSYGSREPSLVKFLDYCYRLSYSETPCYETTKELFVQNNINDSL